MPCNISVVLHAPTQVRSGLFGSQLQKVSEYGADESKGAAPVCLLYSGNHYDLLIVSK